MNVVVAEHLGLCFGVRDALAATRRLDSPAQVTIFGQLVHNPLVAAELAERGFQMLSEQARSSGSLRTRRVLITAHGISDRERAALLAGGNSLVDTTCPLVKKAHEAALKLRDEGRLVVILGRRDHIEVRGLAGDLDAYEVVESAADVRRFPADRLGIIAQTTTPEREALPLVRAIQAANPQADVRFINTICQPTRDRQAALETLLGQIDVLVVVGGRHSNNTRQLAARAREAGVRALHIEDASELVDEWFQPGERVGLTAGTSTLPETVEAVQRRLVSMHETPAPQPRKALLAMH
jgi:4-hydroxy-3-methylbut-2-enyl diphosphate reductase